MNTKIADQIEVKLRTQRNSLLAAAKGILALARDPAGRRFTLAEMLDQIEGLALEQAVSAASYESVI